MNRYLLMAAVVALTGAAALTAPAAEARTLGGATGAGGGWAQAEEVPGLAALNTGDNASIGPMSCASPGNCTAAGYYTNSSGGRPVFVDSQVNGAWGQPQKVPRLGTLDQGDNASVRAISCRSAGTCSAGGTYTDSSGHTQAFVVSQVKGTWGKAEEVPGLAALNQENDAAVLAVSCDAPGNCSAGGYYTNYTNGTDTAQAFVVNQVNGAWGQAEEVPGTGGTNGLNTWNAQVSTISCDAPGNCSAGGYFTGSEFLPEVLVVSEVNGTWGQAQDVGYADGGLNSLSCASAGNCGGGGYRMYYNYNTTDYYYVPFVISQVKGTWGQTEDVPGLPANTSGEGPETEAVSCGAAGNCGAGGWYTDSSGSGGGAFLVSQVHGTWRKAKLLPDSGSVILVSCASAGNCSAAGNTGGQAFLITQTHGTWGKTQKVPGLAALSSGRSAEISSLSCSSASHCSAGGEYVYHHHGRTQAWVASRS